MDAEAELAELRDAIEKQVHEYVELVKRLEVLTRKMTPTHVLPATYHDEAHR
jgi:hypothetical protein